MTKNVKTIIKYYLFAIGKVGLVSEKYGCECSRENLMSCGKKNITESIYVFLEKAQHFLNIFLPHPFFQTP